MTASTLLQTDRFEVGQIVCSSYGYDMTLVEYYVVTRMTKASVWLRPINCVVTNDDGRGEGRAMPDSSWQASDDKVFRKKIQLSDGKQYVSDSIKYFRIWDGKPQYYNSWD
tara:strand:+ start:1177 stop:1509 length:333 start_codon:yes stop_codon:yes gene_type:complete